MDSTGVSIGQAASAGGTIFVIGLLFGWLWAKLHNRSERKE